MVIPVYAPVSGEGNFSQFSIDDLFKANILGQGIIIWPTNNQIMAPFDGTYYQQNDHNIQIQTAAGRWLLHLGLNFAGLPSVPVTYLFTDGASVAANSPIATVDWARVATGNLDVIQEVALINLDQQGLISDFSAGKFATGGIIGKLITTKGTGY